MPSCKARDFGGLTLEADRKVSNGTDASGDHRLPPYLTEAWAGSRLGLLPKRGHSGHRLTLAAESCHLHPVVDAPSLVFPALNQSLPRGWPRSITPWPPQASSASSRVALMQAEAPAKDIAV